MKVCVHGYMIGPAGYECCNIERSSTKPDTDAPWQKPTIARKHRPDVIIEDVIQPARAERLVTRLIYPITAMGKPRATQRDKWNPSKAVQKYRLFADTVRLYGIEVPDAGQSVTFVMPMPKSWSNKKKAEMDCQPHQKKPDIDNLLKALYDAARKGHEKDDCTIWQARASKFWGQTGAVIIENYEVQQCLPRSQTLSGSSPTSS